MNHEIFASQHKLIRIMGQLCGMRRGLLSQGDHHNCKMTENWKVLELSLIELILQTESKFVQVIMTKYQNRAKQNIPNYTGSIIAQVSGGTMYNSGCSQEHPDLKKI